MTESFAQVLIAAVPPDARRFLEVGTGSGRTTWPLLDALRPRDEHLIGVDLSCVKLRRLASQDMGAKLSLAQADATHLPFPTACFDVIITVHVLHLIPAWETALYEFRRLLRPGGVYLRRSNKADRDSIRSRLRHLWQVLLDQNHLAQRHQDRSGEAFDAALSAMGASCTPIEVSTRTVETTPGREVERIASRVRDGAWAVPAKMLPRLLSELRTQAIIEYTSLEQ
jgi:SAM-dependent methyltransferase